MYPMPNFALMKGQELIDAYNLYATKPRQSKFHDNEQGRRVCEDLWRKWAAKNPPKGKEVVPPAPKPDLIEIQAREWVENQIKTNAEDELLVQEAAPIDNPQEWDISESPATVKQPAPEPSKAVEEVSSDLPRPGSKAGRLARKLLNPTGLTLTEGMELTGWATPDIVRSELTRIAHKLGRIIVREKREGKESLFRMEG